MEQKITPSKLYEDQDYIAFENPETGSVKLYLKQKDDFHNNYAVLITVLDNQSDNNDATENLLFKFLKQGVPNG